MRVTSQIHAPAALSPGRPSGIHRIRGWVDTRAGLDAWRTERALLLPGIEPRSSIL